MTTPADSEPAPRIVDDKSPICIPFILSRLKEHRSRRPHNAPPFVLGLNGVQGVGKTTLVQALAETLQVKEGLQTLVCSIDDFYLTRVDQARLAAAHPGNPLVQHRGEPGTHDVPLLRDVLTAVLAGQPARVPRYDKAAHAGRGDRLPESSWTAVNGPGQPPVQVVVLEGWCVGFRAVPPAAVEARWRAPARALGRHRLGDLLYVNERLATYAVVTDLLDALVHIDAEDLGYVYAWRQEQEDALRRERGEGGAMTPEEVTAFVDGYFPAYELYSDGLRKGIFPGREGRQLRLVVDKNRKVKESRVI